MVARLLAPGGEDATSLPIGCLSSASMMSQTRQRASNLATISKYLIAQVYLGAEICLDRNYVAIELVSAAFPYDLCVAIVKNDALPNRLKAAFVRLLLTVYVDADPQVETPVPRLSHAYNDIANVADVQMPSVPELRQNAFWLLQDVVADQLATLSDSQWDTYTQACMQLLNRLVNFRFYTLHEAGRENIRDLRGIVRPIVLALDRRGTDFSAAAAGATAGRGEGGGRGGGNRPSMLSEPSMLAPKKLGESPSMLGESAQNMASLARARLLSCIRAACAHNRKPPVYSGAPTTRPASTATASSGPCPFEKMARRRPPAWRRQHAAGSATGRAPSSPPCRRRNPWTPPLSSLSGGRRGGGTNQRIKTASGGDGLGEVEMRQKLAHVGGRVQLRE